MSIDTDLRLPKVTVPQASGRFARWEFPAFVRQAERFADAIEGRDSDGPAAATFEDGVACQAVMDAAREGSRLGRWIDLMSSG